VVVTGSTPTVLYIQHSGGIGSIHLKDLPPELKQKYGFDATKAAAVEKQQKESHRDFAKTLAAQPKQAPEPETSATSPPGGNVEGAKSYLNRQAPPIGIGKWLGPQPDAQGKFILIDFWATWCGPCRRSIPHLNAIHAKYGDRILVVGLSDEPENKVRAMTEPKIEYYSAIDLERRTMQLLELRSIPHALLIDPNGVVRFQGHPAVLTDAVLDRVLTQFGRR
jgi:thiol-disulfide isomerase/thioredoxin